MNAPRQFGKYTLDSLVERRRLGETWTGLASTAPGAERKVSVTLLAPEYAADADFVKALVADARTLVGLAHANVVTTFEVGRADVTYFAASEFFEGRSLDDVLADGRRNGETVSAQDAVYVAKEILAGLAYAQAKPDGAGTPVRLSHGDLSGESVFIGDDGTVRVRDFVIARAAVASDKRGGRARAGTLSAAPEALLHGAVDGRSDVYSVGVVLWELLSGRAYDGAVTLGDLRRDLPAGLEALVARAIDSIPEARFVSATAMWDELDRISYAAGRRTTAGTFAETLKRARDAARSRDKAPAFPPAATDFIARLDAHAAAPPEAAFEGALAKPAASVPPPPPPASSALSGARKAAADDRSKGSGAGPSNGNGGEKAVGTPRAASDEVLSLFVSPSPAIVAGARASLSSASDSARPIIVVDPFAEQPRKRSGAAVWALSIFCVLLLGIIGLLLEHFQPGFYRNLFTGRLDEAKTAKKQAEIDRRNQEAERMRPKYGQVKISANAPATYVVTFTDANGATQEFRKDYLQSLDMRDQDIAKPFTVRIEAKGYVPQTISVGRDDWTSKGDLHTYVKNVMLECSPDNKECIAEEAAARAADEKDKASAAPAGAKKRRGGGGGRREKVWDEEARKWK